MKEQFVTVNGNAAAAGKAAGACRACGTGLADGPRFRDARGSVYCGACAERLRKLPPYQAPLFPCTACGRAWPIRTLSLDGADLLCKECGADPAKRTASVGGAPASSQGMAAGRTATAARAAKTNGSPGHAPDPAAAKAPWGALGPPPKSVLPKITCPHCWHEFATEDVLWVSRHSDLLGDPVLGPDAALRFRPSRFTAAGEALDARDMPCQGLACPRCHLGVPRALTEVPPLFVSLIGGPASGKSHFLASMAWEMRRVMAERFGMTFNDADVLSNQLLNEYEQTLFLRDDQDSLVTIRKTELQGGMYDQVRFGDQLVLLPKPFLFTLRPTRPARRGAAQAASRLRMMCLYDNAGEHFQPGMDTTTMPGTQHLAKSRALWFLFDPTQHPRFREQCRSLSNDPQLTGRSRTQRQEVLLSEAAERVRRYTNRSAGQKHDRPLVVIVSKADIWSQLLGLQLVREPLLADPRDPTRSVVDVERVERISAGLRELLKALTPEFVAAAEDFCRHVVYVPVSALGRGPEVDERTGTLGIRPRDVRPQWVTVPVLYMLAKWAGGYVPGSSAAEPATPLAAGGGGPERPDAARDAISIVRPAPRRQGQPSELGHMELVYTSAPRGLRPGSMGFCTVAMTAGMPTSLAERLEALSSYDPPAVDANGRRPAVVSHLRVPVGPRLRSVLSRVSAAGLDYSGRENKLACHFVVDSADLPAGGPAWLALQPGVLPADRPWEGEPLLLPATKSVPAGDAAPRRCDAWEAATGDAGWGGELAAALAADPEGVNYIVHPPGLDPLPLVAEALSLLPPALRWRVTFTTAFTSLPVDLTCAVRCVIAGGPRAAEAQRLAAAGHVRVFDLTAGAAAPETGGAAGAPAGASVVAAVAAAPAEGGVNHG